MSHTHINPFQRNELAILLRAGLKQKEIAKLLKKTPSAICQELKRNPANTSTEYSAKIAKENTTNRRIEANKTIQKKRSS